MGSGRRLVLLGVVWLVASAAITATPVGGTADAGVALREPQQAADGDDRPDRPAADNTVTRIRVAPDGTATWTVRIRTRLETEEEVATYREFQAAFRNETDEYVAPFRTRIRRVAAAAENETGREMRAHGFSAETTVQELPRRWGVVTYEFTWEGFAATDGEAVVVGDVFEQGFYLAENDTLEVIPPAGYAVAAADPDPTLGADDAVGWTGPEEFADGRPLVRLSPSTAGGDRSGTVTPHAHGDSSDWTGGLSADIPPLLGVVGLLALAVLGYTVKNVGRSGAGLPDTFGTATSDRTGEPDTDEERVVALLEENGGQMHQSDVDDAFDWSKAKTSRVLSRLAEEGTVEKTRLGRRNVVELVGDGSGEPP